MGFDQWAQLYYHYRVISAKITCRFVFESTDTFQGAVGIALQGTTTTAGHDLMVEQGKNYRWRNVHNSATNDKDITVSKTYSARKYFGPMSMTKDQYAAVSTSPVEDVYFALVVYRRWAAAAAKTVVFDTKISFYVEFCEPKPGIQS